MPKRALPKEKSEKIFTLPISGQVRAKSRTQIARRSRYDDGMIHKVIRKQVGKTIVALEIKYSNSKQEN